MMPLIVAIDGPAGVGKSTVSRLVARALGVPMIDTGAMDRAIGLAAGRRGIDLHDAAALEAMANETRIDFIPGEPPRTLLDGEGVTDLIRTPQISMAASQASAAPTPPRGFSPTRRIGPPRPPAPRCARFPACTTSGRAARPSR